VKPPANQGVAVLTVATNRYIDYWRSMAESADRLLSPGASLTFYVFTDQPDKAKLAAESFTRSHVVPILIPPLGWPEATLLRYELFDQSWGLIQEDLVIHLDADMFVSSKTMFRPAPTEWPNGLAFVRHPGYRRPSLSKCLSLYLHSPKMLQGDIKLWLRLGALGNWETSRDSRAYVPRRLRQTYVCGGTWMGLREPLGRMIRVLADRTREDLDRGIIATWHDESHLNWFASGHAHQLMDSQKCYAPGYKNLSDIWPEIIAVDKGDDRTR